MTDDDPNSSRAAGAKAASSSVLTSQQRHLSPDQIVARLAHLPEASMRTIALGKLLSHQSTEHAAWILDSIASVGSSGGTAYQLALRAAVTLGEGKFLDPKRRRKIRQAAESAKLEACRELLSESPQKSGTSDIDNRDAPRPLAKGSRPLTLGERKSLARSWDRATLASLWSDPSPKVLGLLLNNPRITEDDILKMVTFHRHDPDILLSIATHRRWSIQPRVQMALIRQKQFPESAALRIIASLSTTQRNSLLCESNLSPRIFAAIRRRLLPPC